MKHYFYALSFCLIVIAGCQSVPVTGRRQLSLVSDSRVASMSAEAYDKLLNKSTLSRDAEEVAMVKRVGNKIAQAAAEFLKESGAEDEIDNYNWEFNLIKKDDMVNAFCMPGGKVAVYTGILPITEDEAGLAVVIGHEAGHAIAKHGKERMSQMMAKQFGGLILSFALRNKQARTRKLWNSAYGLGSDIGIMLPYSRKHEYEADHIGLILMTRAGYRPQAAVEFWSRMEKSGGENPPEFLSTHPVAENRIAEMKKRIPEVMKYYK